MVSWKNWSYLFVQSLNIILYFQTDHVLNIWIKKNQWKDLGELVHVSSQDANIKTKNITEKIEFDNLAQIMASCL